MYFPRILTLCYTAYRDDDVSLHDIKHSVGAKMVHVTTAVVKELHSTLYKEIHSTLQKVIISTCDESNGSLDLNCLVTTYHNIILRRIRWILLVVVRLRRRISVSVPPGQRKPKNRVLGLPPIFSPTKTLSI